jgi:hypothetical protein
LRSLAGMVLGHGFQVRREARLLGRAHGTLAEFAGEGA